MSLFPVDRENKIEEILPVKTSQKKEEMLLMVEEKG